MPDNYNGPAVPAGIRLWDHFKSQGHLHLAVYLTIGAVKLALFKVALSESRLRHRSCLFPSRQIIPFNSKFKLNYFIDANRANHYGKSHLVFDFMNASVLVLFSCTSSKDPYPKL